MASLDLETHVSREAELNREARDYTRQVFTDLGFTVAPSQTNFVMAHIERDVKEFQSGCREQGVLLGRPFPPLTKYARVSIGTLEEMREAADVFRRVLNRG